MKMPESVAHAALRTGRYRHFRSAVAVLSAAIVLTGGAAAASTIASSRTSTTIHGCENIRTGALRVLLKSGAKCPRGTRSLSWNTTGPQGPAGPRGPAGTTGLFGTNTNVAAAGTGATCTLGEIILSAGSVANGMIADGQLLNIAQNTALFTLLGTEYGGNGTTTFALPDLRGSAPDGLTYSICTEGVYPGRS
jgi:Phage Tail Collar Domain